jgi:hypothetical protein
MGLFSVAVDFVFSSSSSPYAWALGLGSSQGHKARLFVSQADNGISEGVWVATLEDSTTHLCHGGGLFCFTV